MPKFCVSFSAYNLCIISITQSSFEATLKVIRIQLSKTTFSTVNFPSICCNSNQFFVSDSVVGKRIHRVEWNIEILSWLCELQFANLSLNFWLLSDIYWFGFTKLFTQ
jgi:hypothetical protein